MLRLLSILSFVGAMSGVSARAAHLGPLQPKHQSLQAIDQPALLVVHASYEFDANGSAQKAIDSQIRRFKALGLPVIYLVSDLSAEGIKNWYTEDRSPDYLVYSAGGEHNLPLRNSNVTVVGGFFGNYDVHNGCHTQALRNVVDSYFRLQKQSTPLEVHLPVTSIYFWPDDSLFREKTLRTFSQPSAWMGDMAGFLFSREFSNDGGMELGRPFFYKSKKPQIVKNPFIDVVIGNGSYNPDDDPDNPLSFVSQGGRAVAKDGRYQEADPVSLSAYQFILSASAKPQKWLFGQGARKVQFIFEP